MLIVPRNILIWRELMQLKKRCGQVQNQTCNRQLQACCELYENGIKADRNKIYYYNIVNLRKTAHEKLFSKRCMEGFHYTLASHAHNILLKFCSN